MKNCSICKKELKEDEEICSTCIEFFKYKYRNEWGVKLERFLNSLKKNKNFLEKTKSTRRYKNG